MSSWIRDTVSEYTPCATEDRSQETAIPITLYDSDHVYQQGKTICVNRKYMVYGIRGGYLRVINKFTAKRTLLKGHTAPLSDVRFQSPDSDILASVSKDGNLIIWHIFEPQRETVDYNKLLHLKPASSDDKHFIRVVWHPVSDRVIMSLSHDGWIVTWRTDVLGDQTANSEPLYIRPGLEGMHQPLGHHRVVLNDFAISCDGNYLVTGGVRECTVVVWHLEDMQATKATKLLEWTPHGGHITEPLGSLHFLGSKQRPELRSYLITGGPNNQQFRMWSLEEVFTTKKGQPRMIQSLTMAPRADSPEPAFRNVTDVDPTSSFFVICNQLSSTAMIVNISDPPDAMLLYMTEFELSVPVISFGLSVKSSKSEPPRYGLGLICIQTKCIQLFHFSSESIYPPSGRPWVQAPAVEEGRDMGAPSAPPAPEASDMTFGTSSASSCAFTPVTEPALTDQPHPSDADVDTATPASTIATPLSATTPLSQPESREAHPDVVDHHTADDSNNDHPASERLEAVRTLTTRLEQALEGTRAVAHQGQRTQEAVKAQGAKLDQLTAILAEQGEMLKALTRKVNDNGHQLGVSLDTVSRTMQDTQTALAAQRQAMEATVLESRRQEDENMKCLVDALAKAVSQTMPDIVQAALVPEVGPQLRSCFDAGVLQPVEVSVNRMFDQMNKTLKEGLRHQTTALHEMLSPQALSRLLNTDGATAPPAPPIVDPEATKREVNALIARKEYDRAFALTLDTDSQTMLEEVIYAVDPAEVCGEDSLSGPVLLCLVQRLALDLQKETDCKLKWLEETIPSLPGDDASDVVVPPEMMGEVASRLENFGKVASGGQKSTVKKLLMMVKSLR